MFLRISILVVLFFVVGGINQSGEPPLWVFACLLLQLLLLLSGWLTGTQCHHAGLPTSLRLSLVTPCKLQICYKVQIFLCLIGLFFWSSSWPKLQLWGLLIHISLFLKLKWMPHVHFPWQGIIYLLNFFFLFLYIK